MHKKVNISISKCLSWVTCMSFHLQVKFEIWMIFEYIVTINVLQKFYRKLSWEIIYNKTCEKICHKLGYTFMKILLFETLHCIILYYTVL